MPPPIELQDVHFGYDKAVVLQGINLSIEPNEFVGIFGPNGGGKTTFLKLLMGFLTPTRGRVRIFGLPPERARQRIGYVPQSLRFDKQFPISVLEVVMMGNLREPLDTRKQRALEALRWVELLEMQDQAFGTLSGGQLQRALIARALSGHPELLLLDEPTASIDKDARDTLLALLDELRGKMTILIVTHDLQAIVERTHRLLCLQQTMSLFAPQSLCEHFSLGLYHTPVQSGSP